MKSAYQELREMAMKRNGILRAGALSRLAERLGCSRDTIRRWLWRLGQPGPRQAALIHRIYQEKPPLKPKRLGMKLGTKKWRIGPNGKRIYFDASSFDNLVMEIRGRMRGVHGELAKLDKEYNLTPGSAWRIKNSSYTPNGK